MAALREPLPDADAAHLAGCAACTDEVASLRRGVDVLAVPQLAAPGYAVAPPSRVWDAIAAATGVSASPRPEAVSAAAADAPAPFPLPASANAPAAPAAAPPPAAPPPAARPADPARVRRLRPRRRLLLAVAAALLVGGAVGAGVTALSRQPGTATVARAVLDPIDGARAGGDAAVVREGDAVHLQVDVTGAAARPGAYYEVWLIAPDLTDMVSVGVLHDGHADLDLPDGLDVSRFSLVDVSVEPLDGNPKHSGDSVVRGALAR